MANPKSDFGKLETGLCNLQRALCIFVLVPAEVDGHIAQNEISVVMSLLIDGVQHKMLSHGELYRRGKEIALNEVHARQRFHGEKIDGDNGLFGCILSLTDDLTP